MNLERKSILVVSILFFLILLSFFLIELISSKNIILDLEENLMENVFKHTTNNLEIVRVEKDAMVNILSKSQDIKDVLLETDSMTYNEAIEDIINFEEKTNVDTIVFFSNGKVILEVGESIEDYLKQEILNLSYSDSENFYDSDIVFNINKNPIDDIFLIEDNNLSIGVLYTRSSIISNKLFSYVDNINEINSINIFDYSSENFIGTKNNSNNYDVKKKCMDNNSFFTSEDSVLFAKNISNYRYCLFIEKNKKDLFEEFINYRLYLFYSITFLLMIATIILLSRIINKKFTTKKK